MRTDALLFDETEFHVSRVRAGYRSVTALARGAGISPGYCGQVSRGLLPPAETRAKLAAALGVPEGRIWRVAESASTQALSRQGDGPPMTT